ncbi:MAG: hypothetical protein FGF48_01765 [Candidatus Brockarchaeota archaeon]|nr:hypothetical protein [Candidatus Brockarchaeota archaeon]
MVNTMMLSTVAMVPGELMPAIAFALLYMKAAQVLSQRGEIFNATTALGNLTAMGLIYRGALLLNPRQRADALRRG